MRALCSIFRSVLAKDWGYVISLGSTLTRTKIFSSGFRV